VFGERKEEIKIRRLTLNERLKCCEMPKFGIKRLYGDKRN